MSEPDLRTKGTGNLGAENAKNVLEINADLVVMADDVTKGDAASAVVGALAGPTGAHHTGYGILELLAF